MRVAQKAIRMYGKSLIAQQMLSFHGRKITEGKKKEAKKFFVLLVAQEGINNLRKVRYSVVFAIYSQMENNGALNF